MVAAYRPFSRFGLLVFGLCLSFPAISYADKTGPNRKVHILIAGLTDDKNICKSVEFNLNQMKALLESGLASHHIGTVRVLKGSSANAKSIVETIDRMSVGPNDTLFMYYHGHGAYDPAYKNRDVSGGHFLVIPSGDLLRKDLWDHLRARKAKLTVLVTESCNVRAPAHPAAVSMRSTSTKPRATRDNPVLAALLLNLQGAIDINACAKNEASWNFAPGRGGSYFTDTFVDVVEEAPFGAPAKVGWMPFIKAVSDRASKIYTTTRQGILASPDKYKAELVKQFREQADQRVAIFHMSFGGEPVGPGPVISPKRPDSVARLATWKVGPKGLRLNGSLRKEYPKDEVRSASHQKVYLVELQAGKSYMMEMQSTDMDAYLRVEDSRGNELARDDDSGSGRNARLEFHPTVSGPYRVITTSFAPAVGSFTLSVRES